MELFLGFFYDYGKREKVQDYGFDVFGQLIVMKSNFERMIKVWAMPSEC